VCNLNGASRVDVEQLTIVSVPETYAAIWLSDDAAIAAGDLTCTSLIELSDRSALHVGALHSGPITMRDASCLTAHGALATSIAASSPGAAPLSLEDTARAVFHAAGMPLTITNTSAAPNSDGVRLAGAARMCVGMNPAITTAGSSGFGVNVRAGGTFTCAAAPSGVVGPTADFTIGTAAGEDFPDTDLAASFSARARGGSTVLRSA
jgi:hypothetical protein